MTDPTFERRIHTWLEAGPSEMPDDALGSIRIAIDAVPQNRRPIRLVHRSVPAVQLRVVAAAVVLLVAASAVVWLRFGGSNVANPRSPDDLLYAFPNAATVIERSGVAGASPEVVSVGALPSGRGFVLAASCTGGDGVIAHLYAPREVQAVPSGAGEGPLPRAEAATFLATCDGAAHHLSVETGSFPAGSSSDIELTVAPGVAWQFAVGEFRLAAARPVFTGSHPAAGWFALLDSFPSLVVGDYPTEIQVPEDAPNVAATIQCSGDPIGVSIAGGSPVPVRCTDASAIARFEHAVTGPTLGIRITTAGATWVRVSGEAQGDMTSERPSAPPLPPGLADVTFADSDGVYLAFGRLGSNRQTLVHAPGAQLGVAAGDLIGVALPDGGGGTRLEIWSLKGAAPVRTIARLPVGDNMGRTWVDATHGDVFYTVFKGNFTTEWHRVGVDGSDDRVIASSPDGSTVADGVLASDDSVFVVDWCPADGPCMRAVHDTAADTTREAPLVGDRTCSLIGVVEGMVVAVSGRTCAEGDGVRISTQAVEGGTRQALVEGAAAGVIVPGSNADQLVFFPTGENPRTVSSIPVTGGAPRLILTAGPPEAPTFELPSVRLPGGDWILLAGPLGDTFQNRFARAPVAILLNVLTGETIPLENLPHEVR